MSNSFLNCLNSLGNFLNGVNHGVLFSYNLFLCGSGYNFFNLSGFLFGALFVLTFLTAAHNAHCDSCNE